MIAKGDTLKDATFYVREREAEDQPFKMLPRTLSEAIGGKRVVIFGLPGAYTPTCSNAQLPGFEFMYEEFKSAGIDEVYCTAVNDAFVMNAWAQNLNVSNVKMLPDGNGDFATSVGALVSIRNLGFGNRSRRYAMIVDDMVVQTILVEEGSGDPYGESAPENVIKFV